MQPIQAAGVLAPLSAACISTVSHKGSTEGAAAAAPPRERLPDEAGRALRARQHAAGVGARACAQWYFPMIQQTV